NVKEVKNNIKFYKKLINIKYNAQIPNDSFIKWLKINHYPLNIPLLESKKLIKRMKSDKKSKNQIVQMILLETVGNPRIENLPDEFLIKHLDEFIKELENL